MSYSLSRLNKNDAISIPDSCSVAVYVYNVEVRDSGKPLSFTWLVLKLIQIAPLGEGVNGQNLMKEFSAFKPCYSTRYLPKQVKKYTLKTSMCLTTGNK